jgi:alkanesulfonate monooxygenase SsuD/methylene tetrahydromethanopterin reductase-like flavin-dependent oxidoreductase (luciferase family)
MSADVSVVLNRRWTEESVTVECKYSSLGDATINPRLPEKSPVWTATKATTSAEPLYD